ncbi:MAG: radical SAM protein [Limisphaera sp.]|nr:MAG: radical SAM protein [Limisphaera sp.]
MRTQTNKAQEAAHAAGTTQPSESRSIPAGAETAFGAPRDFLDNRFVYVVISPRARGLSVGINMNPDKLCNFDCLYCEVQRNIPPRETRLDVEVMAAELQRTLDLVRSGGLRARAPYRGLPEELLQLKHVALSGDGEPTLCPNFAEAVEKVVHVRALREFFKLVLITNATELDRPEVQAGLRHFTRSDEIWAKLDGGTQAYLDRVSGVHVPLEKILNNILTLGRQRPVIIQSLFPSIRGEEPPEEEILAFAQRLKELKEAGAQIELVQIYSATRPSPKSDYGHLPLRSLSRIAQTVRVVAGLKAEVF